MFGHDFSIRVAMLVTFLGLVSFVEWRLRPGHARRWRYALFILASALLGTAFGVVQVLLARQNNVHNYLFGIIAIVISIWVHYQSKLYADILLNLYYLVMSIYGWFYWTLGRQKREAPISYTTGKEKGIALGIVLGCFVLMAYWLGQHTDSDV